MIWIKSHALFGQNSVNEIIQRLNLAKFENVRGLSIGKTLTLSYENNIYRDKVNGLKAVIDIVSECGYDTLKIVTLSNDLPMIVTQLKTDDWQKFKTGQISANKMNRQFSVSYQTGDVWKNLRNAIPANSNINKIDLVFYPQFSMMNVLFSQLYEVQFNVAPALEVSLWRGMKFTGQIIFPVTNHYVFGADGDKIRAGFVSLAQEFRMPGTVLGRAVVGKFNDDRYGADLSLTRYLFSGRCYLKVNAGYTGDFQYSIQDRSWYRNDLKTLTWFLKGGYYYQRQNLQFDVSAGRYLNEDYGLSGNCTRYWGETAIGLFATVGGSGKFNGGFHFTLPIGKKHFNKNRSFQIRAPSYFAWEYNAGTEFKYNQIYKTQPNENSVEQFYNPNIIINSSFKK
jgi:hypothetical protein